MEANTQTLRGEMQRMGLNLRADQKAIMAVARDETRRVGQCLQAGIMAPPRAGTNELGGSATAVRPAVEAGEEKLIWGTCWARSVSVTERATVTVTQRGKLNGVTETCTREIREEVTEMTETREMGTAEERLHGKDGLEEVKDEHTHIEVGGQWGRARIACWDPVQAAGWPPPGTRGGSVPP